ncbi:RES family NAD+ phosphorylase [Ancylobacter vacuolatus]|uniref:RES domain-containing protein n=1 Tax=Ancylobacter vacuolatus TaxID=223389 RepID=A0ABU0DNW9_9HYPH|nr:RES family NAD+ phosphorylase [Ancylobacter vacuolatus]MDQ0350130.1 hypothetical protein [Ancylobacter vacuolatus]
MTDRFSDAPEPSYRIIPSRFPPISVFDTVATASDLEAVMDLAGWTSDRLVADRLARLDRTEWVFGQPNASIVMAAFLHVAPSGMRFNLAELGAWYAAAELDTAIVEVAHHLRREAVARSSSRETRTYRVYTCVLEGSYLDIRGQLTERGDLYDPTSYAASQPFGEAIRSAGGNGLIYDSIRKAGGTNVVAHRPRNVTRISQTLHLRITVQAGSRRIEVEKLSTA